MSNDFGFVDYSQAGAVPNIPESPTSTGSTASRDLRPSNSYEMYYHRYTPTSRPTVVKAQLWGDNGYFMNGPYLQPFTNALSEYNQRIAYTQSWQEPAQRESLNRFAELLDKYGSTNSPGALWAIAASGYDPNNDTMQQVLAADARAYAEEYQQSSPMTAASPAANEDTFMDNIWQPVEFLARNAFAALSMPMEAVQGAVRGIGGELADPNAEWLDFEEGRLTGALAQLGSLVMPLIALSADRIRGDNDFINPWEQTEFGQTLLTAAAGSGWDAFTSMQAGLDVTRARAEIEQLPEFAGASPAELDAAATDYAKQKGYYSEPGWFIDETSRVGEAQRQATFDAWAIPGPNDQLTAWTLGRGIMSWTVGPDSEAYGVGSGLIDAVAAIAGDPTIIAGKFGVPSKAVKGVTGLIRGADKAVLVGKEAAKARATVTRVNLALENAQKMAAKGDEDKARRILQGTMTKELGRALTDKELKDLITEPIELDRTAIALMEVGELSDMTLTALKAQQVEESMKAVSVDATKIGNKFKELRRAKYEERRLGKILEKETDGAVFEGTAVKPLWDSYLLSVFRKDENGNMVYYPAGVNDFAARRLGYDERLGVWTDPESKALFDGTVDLYRAWTNGKDEGLSSLQDMEDFGRALGEINVGTLKRPADIPIEQVEKDLVRLYLDRQNLDEELGALKEFGYYGTVVDGIPEAGRAVAGVVDNANSVIYWAGKSGPVLAEAAEFVPDAVKARLKREVKKLFADPTMTYADDIKDFESVAGQVAAKANRYADPRGDIDAALASKGLTWNALLNTMSNYGLDGFLSDILTTGKKDRYDGITGINNVAGRTWLGDDARFVSYSVDPAARPVADTIRTADDLEAALESLASPNLALTATGVRALSVSEIGALRQQSGSKAAELFGELFEYRKSRVVAADRQDKALDEMLKSLDKRFEDPETALKETLGWHAGFRSSRANGITLDEAGVRSFLFGNGPLSYLGNRALDSLSDFIPAADRAKALDLGADSEFYQALVQRSMGELALITNRKWSGELYRAVAVNAIEGNGRTGLIDILAPRLGVDVSAGDIAKTTQMVGSDGKSWMRSVRRPNGVVARALGQMPTPLKVDIRDSGQTADAVFLYARYAKLPDEFIADQLGTIMMYDGKMEAAAINRNALAATFNRISEVLVQRIDDSGAAKRIFSGPGGADRKNEIIAGIKNSTRIFLGGLTDEASQSKELYANAADVPRIITSDGREIVLPSIQLESEIAQGYVGLPDVKTWETAISTFTKSADALSLASERFKTVGQIKDLATRFFDNVFRAGLLAFRIAYIARNVAEMQVRMFLNGHKSIMSDPATMIGMTFGNSAAAKKAADYKRKYKEAAEQIQSSTGEKATRAQIEEIVGPRPVSKWSNFFAPYKNTVLDTSFEVGDDEALAILNDVENYFQITRSAHSLTDPRVYNSAVRQNWRPVAYSNKSSKFNEGWAHELMMLERSPIARLVAGGKESQFASLDALEDSLNTRVNAVRRLMYDDEFESTRSVMIAADSKFADIFVDEQATMEYLFSAQNSVFNRIKQLTAGNPDLVDYIRTGVFRYPGGELKVRSIKDQGDRVRSMSRVLSDNFNGKTADGFNWEEHFVSNSVTVPWVEKIDARQGAGLMNSFFRVAAKFERLGAVGPEFRMAYWDKIAELAPGLRAKDIDRALKGASSTLSPLKRMNPDGKLVDIGTNHPAWEALNKARKNESDGLLTLDQIHDLAMSYAADDITKLFYDAARRNNFWYKMRMVVPFGQAWGNTLSTWTQLGAKQPIQIYKAQKALNAMIESGSSAVYEAGQNALAYGQYAPGYAPWEQDSNGGFFYTNQYGQSSFIFPFAGRAAAAPLKLWGLINGVETPDELPMESPVSSLNLAMGGDSILPGVGPLGSAAVNLIPDDVLNSEVSQLSEYINPFGEKNILEAGIPAWLSKLLGGVGAVPGIGPAAGPMLDVLAESNKNKHLRDAFMILSTTGNYPDFATNDQTQRQMQEDAVALAKAMLFTTGLIQNVLPSTPIPQPKVSLEGDEFKGELEDQDVNIYTIGMLNSMFQQYLPRNGYDSTAAREEFVKDFGPAALFATTGDWKAFTRRPTSQALRWAQDHPEIAKANMDEFTLFFPQGDSSDVEALRWLRKNSFGTRERKNADDIYTEIVSYLERVQRFRVNSMEANGVISSDEAEAAREEINQRYIVTGDVAGRYINKTDEMEKLFAFVSKYDEIKASDAGNGFMKAWVAREEALTAARQATGRDDATLGSKEAFTILQWYKTKINEIQMQHPDFILLANKFRREWE